MLIDTFGRQITYLRISVTDRCNLRCVYCIPPEGVPWQPHESILTYEEILRVVNAAAKEGIREVRLTGGEPLVRKDLPDLVKMIADVPGIEDISLTTNGILLAGMAKELSEAGLQRVNVSLDTLQPEKFARITRGGSLQRVWQGIRAAEENGLFPIKINVVVMQGVNDDELPELALLSIAHPWHVRFIELMPVKNQSPWGEGFPMPVEAYLSIREIFSRLQPLGLTEAPSPVGSGPAQEYRLANAQGTIGFISPVGDSFCQNCNRLRLTADGRLRPCLLSDIEVPVIQAVRGNEEILPYLKEAVRLKPREHELEKNHSPELRCMRQIGG
jgi:GTP 3',8-cyclase